MDLESKVDRFLKNGFTPWCHECHMKALRRNGNAGCSTASWVDQYQNYLCSEHVVGRGPARRVYLREYLVFFCLPFAEIFSYALFHRLADRLEPFC